MCNGQDLKSMVCLIVASWSRVGYLVKQTYMLLFKFAIHVYVLFMVYMHIYVWLWQVVINGNIEKKTKNTHTQKKKKKKKKYIQAYLSFVHGIWAALPKEALCP